MDNLAETSPSPAMAAAAAVDLTGQTLGDFRLLRKLGQGGMGQVYLAEQLSLKRKVAIKLLRPDLAANARALERFKLEAEAVARATHANIVQVYFIGEAQGHHYMALEYVEGRNLRDYLARKGPPEVLLALSIMRQVAAALQRAGELGIIHRDIKPDNILLTRKGEAKVADFGLSRCLEGEQPALHLTASGVTMGTPLYMSPEQVEGKPVDPRTDIYSFGVTCYHMLSGQPPFRGSTAFEVALQHVRDEPAPLGSVRPDLPPELCAVVHKMMAKHPDQRYQIGRELLKDLVRVRDSLAGVTGCVPLVSGPVEIVPTAAASITSASAKVPVVTPARRSRNWVAVAFVLSLVAALAAGVGLGIWRQRQGSVRAREEASEVLPAEPSQDTREEELRATVEHYLDPANLSKRPETGVRLCLDLALPYLEQNRLEEASQFFTRLAQLEQASYHTLGVLGQAIVLGLQDRAVESNLMFRALQRKGTDVQKVRIVARLLRNNPELARWVAEAVYHNVLNGLDPQKDMPRYLAPYARGIKKRPEAPSRGAARRP
jgi:serine/threonine-protein kinase